MTVIKPDVAFYDHPVTDILGKIGSGVTIHETYKEILAWHQNELEKERKSWRGGFRIFGYNFDEIIKILAGLEIEQKTNIPVTIDNLSRLIEEYDKEQRSIVAEQISRMRRDMESTEL